MTEIASTEDKTMTPKEIQSIYDLLANRVKPESAREGAAILQLAAKLVSHFAKQQEPPKQEPPVE